jgi:3-hydroxyacyl-[acyl-carrier-protein] dehydratase
MKEVEVLIPHRDPFLYVDKLIALSKDEIIGTKIFADSDSFLRASFPEFYFVPGVILMEAMAQCGGAGIKKLGLADGLFGLANIENASFFRGVEYEKEFRMVIKNIKVAEKFLKQCGTGYVDGQACLEFTWTCIKFQ